MSGNKAEKPDRRLLSRTTLYRACLQSSAKAPEEKLELQL